MNDLATFGMCGDQPNLETFLRILRKSEGGRIELPEEGTLASEDSLWTAPARPKIGTMNREAEMRQRIPYIFK